MNQSKTIVRTPGLVDTLLGWLLFASALTLVIICGFFSHAAYAEKFGDEEGPSATPWNDPDDLYILRLNRDDPTALTWNDRNDNGNPKREAGPIDLQRYKMGFSAAGFPTFFNQPIAMTPEDLKAGDVDVAIVGSATDNNPVRGTSFAANMLRSFVDSSGNSFFFGRGGGKMRRERSGNIEQYVRSAMHELNIVDYGNILVHPFSIDKSAEETRDVLLEILGADVVPMLVGGSHDNMYGGIMAMAEHFGRKKFGILHFDSHMDAKKLGFGFYVHNGNGIYWGPENGLVDHKDIVQVGMTSNFPDDEDLEWATANNIRYHYQAEIEKDGWETVMRRVLKDVKDIENLYVTIDIDIIAAAHVPGTGGREVDGILPSELMKMVRAVAIQNNVRLIEICEYNPMLDSRSQQTALVTKSLMRHFLAGLATKRKGITDPFYYHPQMIDDSR